MVSEIINIHKKDHVQVTFKKIWNCQIIASLMSPVMKSFIFGGCFEWNVG